jgi:hypothetical protein
MAVECVERMAGKFYDVAVRRRDGRTTVLIRNARPPERSEIERDATWHRRLELAGVLGRLLPLGRVPVSATDVLHRLPLAIVTESNKEALGPLATTDDVLRAFTLNTQRRFERVVADLLGGKLEHDTMSYSVRGVDDPSYSHIEHLGWVYARQIELVEHVLREDPLRTVTVVDLGTGGGHLLLTLAARLAAADLLHRVRLIGVDRPESRDMKFAAELAPAYGITFKPDDLSDPTFADRLRRLRPDVIVANHVLEHLRGEIYTHYLYDWLLAASTAVSISLPLEDKADLSISRHLKEYSADAIEELGRHVELRSAYAVEARDIERTKYGGLCTWVRRPEVIATGGFDPARVLRLTPSPAARAAGEDPILQDFCGAFDVAEFARARRAPSVGEIKAAQTFAREGHPRQVRQLLIKAPHTDVFLPAELAQFAEAVQLVVDHNRSVNPDYDDSYAYINVFRGITQMDAYRGLSLSCHGDQMQCLRPEFAYKNDYSYIASSTLPTILYEQGFDLSEAVARFREGERVNLYEYFNRQADPARVYRTQDFNVYLLSPYVVHSAAAAPQDVYRVFVKVAFSLKRFFDNRELRRNPAFDVEDWYLQDTVGALDGWLSHAHWNERFLRQDVCPEG